MSLYLRQSTASQEILLGPFVNSGDGDTAETALTIANTDIKLWVEGATTLANKNSGGATHISNGYYYAVLDATDTAAVGKLEVNIKVSGALAIRREYHVLEEAVYDSLFAAAAAGAPSATTIADAVRTEIEESGSQLEVVHAAIVAAGELGDLPTAPEIADEVRSELAVELARIDAATSTRLASGSYSAPPSASTVASAVRTELTTELGRIDAATSTRLASAGYTAPDNSTISTIATRIGTPATNLASVIDTNLDAKVSEVEGGGGGGGPPLTEQGEENYQTFFNNDGAPSTKTIASVTTPRNIIIQTGDT